MSNRPKQRPSKPAPGTTVRGGSTDRPAAPRASGGAAPPPSAGPGAPPAPGARRKRTGWLIGGIVAVIVAAAAALAIASSSEDEASPASTTPSGAAPCPVVTASSAAGAAVPDGSGAGDGTTQEQRPVTVTGTPLAPGTEGSLCAQVPAVTGQTFDGAPITIGAPGRATLVAFVAHWCPHCQREVPRLVEWASNGGLPADVGVVAVATATTDTRDNYPPSEWLQREAWPWPVLVDDEESTAANAFGVSGFPFFALYDADGKLVLRTSGELDTAELGPMITDALGR